MLKKRINIKDIPNEEFYKLPKVFIWKKQYRENLSIGAKLLYMLIRDRFNLSIYTTQISVDNGND
ncbi:replication initiator A domain-containing protein, partial [Bacillus cereus]